MPGSNPLPPLDPKNVYHERNGLHAEYDANGKLIGYRVFDQQTLFLYGAQIADPEKNKKTAEAVSTDNVGPGKGLIENKSV